MLRDRPAESYAVTLAVMVLVFIWDPIPATGTPAGIIVFTLLALLGTYLLRRQTALEFPDARSGATTAAARARIETIRLHRQRARTSATPAAASISDQLRQLADLHDHGAISADEYQAAKAQLLHG